MNGLTLGARLSGITERMVWPVSMPCVTLAPAAHHAVLSSDTSNSTASPVRSRWNRGGGDAVGDVHSTDRVAEMECPGTVRHPAPRG